MLGLTLSRATPRLYRFETSLKRLNCANTGHSPTAQPTGKFDPERALKIDPMNGR
jgi:hypothetical protein